MIKLAKSRSLSSLIGIPRKSSSRTFWTSTFSSLGVSLCIPLKESRFDRVPFILRCSVVFGTLYSCAACRILGIWPSLIACIARSRSPSFVDDCALFGGVIACIIQKVVIWEICGPLGYMVHLVAGYVTCICTCKIDMYSYLLQYIMIYSRQHLEGGTKKI